jgi:amino acid adenylation domain-containing protein
MEPVSFSSSSLLDPDGFVPFPDSVYDQSMAEAVHHAVELYPARVAIHADKKIITYRELDELTNCLAKKILEVTGDTEENISIMTEQGLNQIICILSILKAGKIYSAMDLSNPTERLTAMIADFGSRITLTDSQHVSQALIASADTAVIIEVDKLGGSREEILVHRPYDHLAGIYYTSGSTGQPKGVVYDHRSLLHYAITSNHCYRMTKTDKQPLPYSCSFAWSAPILFGTLLCGGTLFPINLREMNMGELALFVDRWAITILQFTPSILRPFMASLDSGYRHFPNLRLIVTGGESLQIQDVKLWQGLFDLGSKLGYILASTEASYITFQTYGTTDTLPSGNLPVGKVVPGKEVMIVDEEKKPLPVGEIGEIAVRSHYGSRGYWRKPDLTQTAFVQDIYESDIRTFYTGDLGRVRPDEALEHFGRKDDIVKIRGYRVSLAEVQAALYQLPGIKEAVIIAGRLPRRPDENQLIAYVVLRPRNKTTASSLRQSLAMKLPDYMVPPFIIFLEALPLNINGKIDKGALPAVPERQELLANDLPTDPFEKLLVSIWKKVFRLEKISVHDSFFDLGGDSLMAVSIFLYVERSFSRRFPSSILLQYPTIRSLASLLRAKNSEQPSSIIPVQPRGNKTPLFWIPSGFGVDLYVQGAAKYLAPDQPLYLLAVPNSPLNQLFLIEELAEMYAREIQLFFPHGPYYLLGHSVGGTIACETARELVRSGGKVRWVGMLDSAPPNTSSTTLPQCLRLFMKNISPLGISRSLNDLGRNVFLLFAMTLLKPQWIRATVLQKRKIPVINMLGARQSTYVKSFFISELYRPKPYPFDLLVFRATGVRRYSLGEITAGWDRFAGNELRYLDVPGDHVSIMEEPNIGVLAKKICEQVNG